MAASLARHPDDPERCAADFRRALVGWFWRLPWGIGMATIRSCLRATVGLRPSGVLSRHGAAMRAVVVGAFFHDREDERRAFGRALAEVTHRDERAVQGALAVAEVAAAAPSGDGRGDRAEPSLGARPGGDARRGRRSHRDGRRGAGRLGFILTPSPSRSTRGCATGRTPSSKP